MIFSDLPSPAEASNGRSPDLRGFAQAGNRNPLFGIMLLSTSPPPRQPLISRAAGARVMAEPTRICKFPNDNRGPRPPRGAATTITQPPDPMLTAVRI